MTLTLAPPSRASSPRPRPLFLVAMKNSLCGYAAGGTPLAARQLSRQRQIGQCALGLLVVDQRRYAMAGRFGQPHVARDDGIVELVAEMRLELLGHVVGQAAARVVHGAQQAFDL